MRNVKVRDLKPGMVVVGDHGKKLTTLLSVEESHSRSGYYNLKTNAENDVNLSGDAEVFIQ